MKLISIKTSSILRFFIFFSILFTNYFTYATTKYMTNFKSSFNKKLNSNFIKKSAVSNIYLHAETLTNKYGSLKYLIICNALYIDSMHKNSAFFYWFNHITRIVRGENLLIELLHSSYYNINKSIIHNILHKLWLDTLYVLIFYKNATIIWTNSIRDYCDGHYNNFESLMTNISNSLHILREENLHLLLKCILFVKKMTYHNIFLYALDDVTLYELKIINDNKLYIIDNYLKHLIADIICYPKFKSLPDKWMYLVIKNDKDIVLDKISTHKYKLEPEDLEIIESLISSKFFLLHKLFNTILQKYFISFSTIAANFTHLTLDIITEILSNYKVYDIQNCSFKQIKPFLLILEKYIT